MRVFTGWHQFDGGLSLVDLLRRSEGWRRREERSVGVNMSSAAEPADMFRRAKRHVAHRILCRRGQEGSTRVLARNTESMSLYGRRKQVFYRSRVEKRRPPIISIRICITCIMYINSYILQKYTTKKYLMQYSIMHYDMNVFLFHFEEE